MTPVRHSLGANQSLDQAGLRMAELRVSHLPVLEAGQPVGMLSDRDIAWIRSVLPRQVARITVEEAMRGVPYCVTADTSIAEAARHMALRKLSSALVVEHGQAIGVFTAADALALLAELLEASAQDAWPRAPARGAPVPALIGPASAGRSSDGVTRHARR